MGTDEFLMDDDNGLVVCKKDKNAVVLYQNKACIDLCGNRLSAECRVGCMELYLGDDSLQWRDWGSRIYKNRFLHGYYFDVTIIATTACIITVLQSLHEKYKQAISYYHAFNLSKRENQIMEMVIKGMSNDEISENLYISVSTLRTHLKNIYCKVRTVGGTVEYVPGERKCL